MIKAEMKEAILAAKFDKGLKWADIAKATGLSPEFTCAACLGMHHLEKPQADAVTEFLGLGSAVSAALQRFPHKTWPQTIPTDPVIYRWYEMIGVYGETIKELIHEKFGDGIMSAIDFTTTSSTGSRRIISSSWRWLIRVVDQATGAPWAPDEEERGTGRFSISKPRAGKSAGRWAGRRRSRSAP